MAASFSVVCIIILLSYAGATAVPSRSGGLRYSLADIVQVCGDGESILHAMQYSLIKRQRNLKESGASAPETAAVSEAQRDLERKFRAWRSGASHMKSGHTEAALNIFLAAYQDTTLDGFASCTIGLLAGTLGDVASAIGFLHLALESSPRDVRLLVSVGDLHLTSGDVEAARNVYETALSEGQSTSEDAITEVLRTPVQVALSAAHRGLAWCALAKQAPNALIVAAKQLKLAIAASSGDHLSMALLASVLSTGVTSVSDNSIVSRRRPNQLSPASHWLQSAVSLRPDSALYHCASAVDALQAAPSTLLVCELGMSACSPLEGRVPSNNSLIQQFLGLVSEFPSNSTWSLLQQGYGSRKLLPQPPHDLTAVTSALNHFQQATWLDGEYIAGHLELGVLLYLEHRWSEAIHALRSIDNSTSILPHVVMAHIRAQQLMHADVTVHCHLSLTKIETAREQLTNVTVAPGTHSVDVMSPFHRPHPCSGDSGVSNSQSLLELELYVRLLLLRSQTLLGNVEAASTHVKELQRTFVDVSTDIAVYYGYLLLDSNRPKDAQAVFEGVILRSSSVWMALRGSAISMLRSNGTAGAAFALLTQAIELNSRDAVSHAYLSLLYFQRGNISAAQSHAGTAARLRPHVLMYRYLCGRLLSIAGSWSEALNEYTDALVVDPACWQCLAAVAEAYEALGDIQRAASALQMAVSLKPDCVHTRCRLGSVLLSQGNVNSATASFDKAWLLHQSGSSSRSMGSDSDPFALSDSCEAPNDDELAACWNNAAVASLSLGYVEDGVRWLETALALSPNFTEAKTNLELTLSDDVIDRASILLSSEDKSPSHAVPKRPSGEGNIDSGSKAVLSSWLGSMAHSMRVLGQSSFTANETMSAPNTTSVSHPVSQSGSAIPTSATTLDIPSNDLSKLLGTACILAPSPRIWDTSEIVLPQLEPVPIDASVGNRKKPAPPPPANRRTNEGVTASKSSVLSSNRPPHPRKVKLLKPDVPQPDGEAAPTARDHSEIVVPLPDDVETVDVVLSMLHTTNGLRMDHKPKKQETCMELGNHCDVKKVDSRPECPRGQLAILWYEKSMSPEAQENAAVAVTCLEAAIAAVDVVMNTKRSVEAVTETKLVKYHAIGGKQSSGWAMVRGMMELRLARLLNEMGSFGEAASLASAAVSHSSTDSGIHLEAALFVADILSNHTSSSLVNNSILSVTGSPLPDAHRKPAHWFALASRHHPNSIEAQSRYGMELFRLRNYEACVEVLTGKALSLSPTDVRLRHLVACALLALEDPNGAVDHFTIGAGVLESESHHVNVSLPTCDNVTSSLWMLRQCMIDTTRSGVVCLKANQISSVSYATLFQSDFLLALHASSQTSDVPSYAFRSMKALSLSQPQKQRENVCVCTADEIIPARAAVASTAALPHVAKAWLEAASGCWMGTALRVQQEVTNVFTFGVDSSFGHAPDVLTRLRWVLEHAVSCVPQDDRLLLPLWKSDGQGIVHESKRSWLSLFHCYLASMRVFHGEFELANEAIELFADSSESYSLCSCVSKFPAVWEATLPSTADVSCQHETERSLQVEISDYAKQMTAARLSLENALGLVSATRTQDAQMLMSGMKCPLPCLPWLSSVQSLIAALSGNSQEADELLREALVLQPRNPLYQLLLARTLAEKSFPTALKMLSNAMEISSSVSNPCQRKQRVLSLLLAASLQLALTTSDNSLRVAVMEQLSSEFGWDPMAQIALGDLLTHGVGVGVSVVVRDVVAPPRLISSGKRLSFSEVQVAIGHYTSAIAVLSNGSFVSSLLRSQPHHPLSLQGLHWNLCGCSICHSNCSWLDVQAAFSLSYPVALRVGASFRLAWFLAEKGTTNTALQAFVSANTTVAEVAVDAYSTVVRKLIAIGHSAVLQETTAILEAISHISQRLDDACTKFHPLRSAVDVCDAIVYQQLAVMLHKRGIDDHSKPLLRISAKLSRSK